MGIGTPGPPIQRPRVTPTYGSQSYLSGDIIVDVTDGHSLELTADGPQIVHVAIVKNLSGTGAAVLYAAATAPGIGKVGDPHPNVPGAVITSIRAELEKDCVGIARVIITYGQPTGGGGFDNEPSETADCELELSSTVQSTATQFEWWLDGNVWRKRQIILGHTFIREDPETQTSYEETIRQTGEVEFQQPMMVFQYRRREPSPPGSKALRHVGTVNDRTIFGDHPARSWMCTRIDGVSDDGGQTYNCTYEFQRAPLGETWDATVIVVDPETGKPVPDPDPAHDPPGIRTCQIYRETNFDALSLTV